MTIPNNIILTYKTFNFPDYIIKNIAKLNPNKNILFFDDNSARNFILEEYGSSYVDFFNSVKRGCTKGDFFRYCYLYKYGGYYCDIDIQHLSPIDSYIESNLEFLSVNSYFKDTTFQAILFCESEHPIIKRCLEDIMKPETSKDLFYHTTEDMYKNIAQYLGLENTPPGSYISTQNKIVQLLQEVNINGLYACLYQNKLVAMSRYSNYTTEVGFTDK